MSNEKNCIILANAAKDIIQLLKTSHSLRAKVLAREKYRPLDGYSMSMIFEKRSTRTHVSCESGMAFLGGHALFLSSQDIQLGVNESLRDTAEVLGRLSNLVLARVYSHQSILVSDPYHLIQYLINQSGKKGYKLTYGGLQELAQYSKAPIINALSDRYHPLQALADLMTVQTVFKHFPYNDNGDRLKLAWVGDGNNVLNSLLMSGLKLGCHIAVATPRGYECKGDILGDAQKDALQVGTNLLTTNDPREAVEKADVIFTDTWVDSALCKLARPKWVFLHCLPRKPYEVTDEIFYCNQSLVFLAAENRKYTAMAVMLKLLGISSV